MEKKKLQIINIFLLVTFLIFGFMVRNSVEGILFDTRILNFLHRNINPSIFKIMKGLSYLGSEKAIIPIMIVFISFNLIKKNIYETIFLLTNTLGSFILNFLLKSIFQRTRPLDFALVNQGGLSFPSGHSMVVMSMYLAILFLLIKDEKNKSKKIILSSIIGIYIFAMGISRIYLGVHWPTDVIGGYICGYLLYQGSKSILKE